MAFTNGRFPTIDGILAAEPPERLFHYTSPAGLIGIAESKVLWATHVKFLNDAKELGHAVELARLVVRNHLNAPAYASAYTQPERDLLEQISRYAGAASADIYLGCLSEERDLLSQWRAYCPPNGGYSLGISSDQLAKMATAQDYMLSPAVYDERVQYMVVQEIITTQIREFRATLTPETGLSPKDIETAGAECAREVSRFGPILKHRSFKEEREWRLISRSPGVNNPTVKYRAGRHSVVPYLHFALVSPQHPDLNRHAQKDGLLVVVGPTRDSSAAQFAIQSLGHNAFAPGWWHSSSETPYRGS